MHVPTFRPECMYVLSALATLLVSATSPLGSAPAPRRSAGGVVLGRQRDSACSAVRTRLMHRTSPGAPYPPDHPGVHTPCARVPMRRHACVLCGSAPDSADGTPAADTPRLGEQTCVAACAWICVCASWSAGAAPPPSLSGRESPRWLVREERVPARVCRPYFGSTARSASAGARARPRDACA